jgi:hypothetical protein
MLSRRALVGKLAAGAAGAAVAWVANIGRANATPTRGQGHASRGSGHGEDEIAAAWQREDGSQRRSPVENKTQPPLSLDNQRDTQREAVDAGANAKVSEPPPWALLRPLTIGSPLAHGWRVAGLSGVEDGVCVLTLQNVRGREHRVHLCRNDGRPQGLVYTDRLDLMVMNGGQGDLPTEEGLAQAVAALAHVLAANETGREQRHVVVALLPHAERLRQFGALPDARLR